MRKTLLGILAVVVLLVACTHTVNVALEPDYETNLYYDNELSKVKPAITFFAGAYEDKRTDNTTLATFKQEIHTFNLYSDRPVDEALFDGLAVLVSKSGHEWNDSGEGQVKVNMQFLNCQAERHAGMIKVGASSSIQIKLDFIDAKTDDMIHTNIYNGADERAQAMVGMMSMVEASIDASLVACVQSVGDDAGLAKALNKLNAEAEAEAEPEAEPEAEAETEN